ncbi:TolB family protein [Cohnella zeiphila]|uniref:Uncharacterized protein n=1 Tax=Cohnella zeiphila TaxID=2761120 RepID=A0A7X0SRD2_9BACL|nr:hypothetical protein [Cohnella zeiphila]MBB6733515.1 hypothetical protein [Cohnella zeiphila]
MRLFKGDRFVILGCALTLATGLAACQPSQDRPENGQAGSGATLGTKTGGGERRLTVVKDDGRQRGEELSVVRIHRLEGANIEAWLSDNEARIVTTKLLKPATSTEEPQLSYTESTVDLITEEQRDSKPQADPGKPGATTKEEASPDGRFIFVQQWENKYTARNFMKNAGTGQSVELKISNYLESGGWLNNDTYVLAAGSMEGRGDVLTISADGTVTSLKLEDPDSETEPFPQFAASGGRIYYTDRNQTLKTFDPEHDRPSELVRSVSQFSVSPAGDRIAVLTAYAKAAPGIKLLMYDANGSAQGTLLGKGDLIPYFDWSPDGSKLAFAVYAEDKAGMNGVYVLDTATGKVSPVGPGAFPQYPLSWNPSGTRLGVTTQGGDSLPVTQIFDFQ